MNRRIVGVVIGLSIFCGALFGWAGESVPRMFHARECSRSLHLHRKTTFPALRTAEKGSIEGVTSDHIRTRAIRDMIVMEYLMKHCADVPELALRMTRMEKKLRPYLYYGKSSSPVSEGSTRFQDI